MINIFHSNSLYQIIIAETVTTVMTGKKQRLLTQDFTSG